MAFAAPFHRRCLGIVLLALWLGWTSIGLGHSARTGEADLAAARALLAKLRPQATQPGPMALRLSSACSCDDTDERDWQTLAAGMDRAGGATLRTSAPPGARRWELLITDTHGQLAYAGPLRAPALLCGDAADPSWARALPSLLQANGPPLVMTASTCDCRFPS